MTIRIITGDCRDVLPTLPSDHFDCVVTSPPYYGLRSYLPDGHADKASEIGLEPTLALYLETMVDVCRELRRVLKPHGTFWLNIGDSYANDTKWGGSTGGKHVAGLHGESGVGRQKIKTGLKAKDLCMVPNRLAITLQDDGWYVRSEIIWHKLNPMPESVTDRPTCAHEKVWLLTKSERYFYDADSIREIGVGREDDAHGLGGALRHPRRVGTDKQRGHSRRHAGFGDRWDKMERAHQVANGANARNVWSIASEPYRAAHYAVMPSTLAERCIKAGTSERGCCHECGKPWERVVERTAASVLSTESDYGNGAGRNDGGRSRLVGARSETLGWQQTCSCDAHEPEPCTVLDPFFGAGTTGLVADRLGRHCTGIELNPANRELGAERVRMDGPLFAEVSA